MIQQCDILIIGGGIIGTAIARNLSKFNKKIILIEKESKLGCHATTRNSGVIHAGIYYSTDSLKAQFCKKGNEQLTQYIKEKNLPIMNTGKFIVATNDQEYEQLKKVKKQAENNKIDIQWMPIKEAIKQEPSLKLISEKFNVIYSPTTKVGCNQSVINALEEDLKQKDNVEIINYAKFIQQKDYIVETQMQWKPMICKQILNIQPKFTINCAGLYADKIAQNYGFCKNYEILPIKGTYMQTNEPISSIKSLVYPVPPVKGSTVLGVHLTKSMQDNIKIGPNAIPAFWREQYNNNLDKFDIKEFSEVLQCYVKNLANKNSRDFYINHAISEIKKLDKNSLIKQANNNLANIIDDSQQNQSLKQLFNNNVRTGIRAQLIDKITRLPVNDFIIESDYKKSMHLLNVVSPGWTCSFPIADHIQNILQQKNIL